MVMDYWELKKEEYRARNRAYKAKARNENRAYLDDIYGNQIKERKCLRCDELFMSKHKAMRMCASCKTSVRQYQSINESYL